jgi:hypothetical protein
MAGVIMTAPGSSAPKARAVTIAVAREIPTITVRIEIRLPVN